MKDTEKEIFTKICSYCIEKYQITNSSPTIASFIYQLCRYMDIDAPACEGILYVEVNGYKRQYAHCFNVYNAQIIDASIYQFALINKPLEQLFPLFIIEALPSHIEYKISNEIKYKNMLKFKHTYLEYVLREISDKKEVEIERFDIIVDSKKENLFMKILSK